MTEQELTESFEPTESELVILNANDREIEEMQANCKTPEGGIMPRRNPETNEQILIAVATIAGWTDIRIWNPSALKKSYTGVNLAHPELGVHIPNYVEDLNAIFWVLDKLGIQFHLTNEYPITSGYFQANSIYCDEWKKEINPNPAIALCKLLLKINPKPIKPSPKQEVAIIDDDGDIDEPTVIEASFG